MKCIIYLIFLIYLTLSLNLSAQSFQINDVRIGDTTINYVNPEISPKGDYMLWIEIDTSNGFSGKVWHCGINPNTGNLIPSNGKGFSSFNSNIVARPADWGVDSIGPYYVGLNISGQFVFVRPTSPSTGITNILPLSPNLRRRVIYPSQLPDTNKRFITYILNNNQPGGSNNPANNSFDLMFLDLDNPTSPITIESQTRVFPSAVGMDVLVPRWIKGTHFLTYGFYDSNNFVQVKEFDSFNPTSLPILTTNDNTIKADGYPVNNTFNNYQYIVSGLNGSDSAIVYRRSSPGSLFTGIESIVPNSINLSNPALNQSHEPFFFNNRLYTTFQLNEDGGSFVNTTLNEPGEIWITSIDSSLQSMWLINDFNSSLNVSEPEPYTGNNKIFIYYSANKIDTNNSPLNRIFQLRRCETPMNMTFNGVNENTENWLNIYPNPTRDIINIETKKEFKYSIFNLKGSLLISGVTNKKIDISSLSKGTFLLVIENKGFQSIKQIIKH